MGVAGDSGGRGSTSTHKEEKNTGLLTMAGGIIGSQRYGHAVGKEVKEAATGELNEGGSDGLRSVKELEE